MLKIILQLVAFFIMVKWLISFYERGKFFMEKTRLNISIPTPLYNLLNADSQRFGISKSTIISNLLLNYYRERFGFYDSDDLVGDSNN